MNIKRVVTGGLVALTAGATLALGAMAAMQDYVVTSDSSLTSPIIVVGTPDTAANAGYAKDVLGAADIAAAVAGYATTDVTVGGGTTVTVSNGADLATTNTKVYLGDNLGKDGLKSTVTKQALPTLLASGSVTDKSGTAHNFDQYINVQGGTGYNVVTFGTSGGDYLLGTSKADPALFINLSTSSASPLYNLTVVFNKVLNISSSNVRGRTITIFGKTYTIGSGSLFDGSTSKLELFGGADSQTLAVGDSAEVTIEGTTHTVSVVGVSDTTTAVLTVDGQTEEVFEGNSYTIKGVDVYVDSIFYFDPQSTSASTVKLSLGSSKVILENGASVKVGQDENTIDGTLVGLTGTANQGISKITVAVGATASDKDWITPLVPFEDPVFGGFKVAFGGLTMGTPDTITLDNAGTTGASLKFTDARNNEKSLTWIYTPTSSFGPQLNASSTQAYVVVEGTMVKRNDYILMSPAAESEFSHIMQYKTASSIGNSNAYIELLDVFSQSTQRIYLTDTGYATATFFIDGQPYYVYNESSSAQTFSFTWGSGASVNNAGDKTTIFPLVQAKNGQWITLTKAVTLTDGTTYEFPTNNTVEYYEDGMNDTTQTFGGRVTYNISSASSLTLADSSGNALAYPAMMMLEEKGKNAADSDVQDAVIVTVSNGGSGTANKVAISAPQLTSGNQETATQETDSSVTEYYDRYGTYIKYDSDNEGFMEIKYPDDQAVAMVGVGSDPSFGTAAGGQTVKSAVMIKNPVAKLDTEVQALVDAGTLNADVILVGGPCANKLTATVMDIPNTKPDCYEQFTYTRLIKEYDGGLVSGKKALVVAGATADDTRSAAAEVMKGTTSLEV